MRGIKRKLQETEGRVQQLEDELKNLRAKKSRDFSELNSRDQGQSDPPVIKTRNKTHIPTNDPKM